jgi:hypothetical protein
LPACSLLLAVSKSQSRAARERFRLPPVQGGRVAVKIVDCWWGAAPCAADSRDLAAAGAPSQRREPAAKAQAALVEALLSRSLSHPHIVTTFCHGATEAMLDPCGRMHQQARGLAPPRSATLAASRCGWQDGRVQPLQGIRGLQLLHAHQAGRAAVLTLRRGLRSPPPPTPQVWIVQQYCAHGSLHKGLSRGLLRQRDGSPNLLYVLLTAQEVAGGRRAAPARLLPRRLPGTCATRSGFALARSTRAPCSFPP